MKKCCACKNDIEDDANFCRFCGAPQDNRKQTEGIRSCEHCNDTGECKKGRTLDKIHSCPYCTKKSGIKGVLFPIVPCGYCDGKGYNMIDQKSQKTDKQSKGRK